MLRKIRVVSLREILSKIPVYQSPNLKVTNSFFNIDNFFYSYSLIKKLISKNNLFCTVRETKITRANLQRFNKPLRRKLLVILSKQVTVKENCMKTIRNFINEQDFKNL